MNRSGPFDDRLPTGPAGRPMGAISTLVSLFLLLLVFFIVLFSIAQVHRQRVDEVVGSIDRAFGGLPSQLGLLAPPAPPTEEEATEAFLSAAASLLTGFPPNAGPADAAPRDALLTVDLPQAELFLPDTAELTARARRLVPPLAVLLQHANARGAPIRLVLRETAADRPALASARLARLAASLYAEGCPADRLAIGFDAGLAASLRFDFEAQEPAEAG